MTHHSLDRLLETVLLLIEQCERMTAELAAVRDQLRRLKGEGKK